MRLFFILNVLLGFGIQAAAQGDLLVNPYRVVFEGNNQKELLNLVNRGSDTTTYSVSFVQKNMKEDGSFVDVAENEPGQRFADPYLRIFPREITLAPQESQTIMLQLRRRGDMESGEYRSHLYFRSQKDYKALGDENGSKDDGELSVKIVPVFGLSIPVIIRTGETNVTATLSDLKVETVETEVKKFQKLNLTINRSGNISLYGDIQVEFIPEKGKAYEIAVINGLGVYTSINKRNISLTLNVHKGEMLTKGKLIVTYRSNGNEGIVYAKTELLIQ